MSIAIKSLSGSWELAWRPRCAGADLQSRPDDESIPIEVPGDVHLALMNAGLISDPVVGSNVTELGWIAEQEWWFTRRFTYKAKGSRAATLVFDGLDYEADVWVNGCHVGAHRNMFRPLRADVTGLLQEVNEIAVRLLPHRSDVNDLPGDHDLPHTERTARTMPQHTCHCRPWMRKAQYTFGWNWTQDLATCGIWRGVRLETADGVVIEEAAVRVALPSLEQAEVTCECEIRSHLERSVSAKLTVEIARRDAPEKPVATETIPVEVAPELSRRTVELTLKDPALWWPAGHGEQPLYRARLRLEVEHAAVAESSVTFGVRRVEIDEGPRPDGEGSRFTLRVNGEPIFARGANWVPADTCPARVTPAKLDHRLQLAREANFNYLRVWGGGIYEEDAFYERCDELGIMVWQDFMFACAQYPDFDADFVAEVREEVAFQVRRLRHHPCIVIWCGNNELDQMYGYAGYRKEHPENRYFGETLFSDLIPGILRDLDPDRPYLRSSGCIGSHDSPDTSPLDPRSGVSHLSLLDKLAGRAHMPVPSFLNEWYSGGPPTLHSLRRYLPREHWSWTSPVWKLHDFVGEHYHEAVRNLIQPFTRDLDFPSELHAHSVFQMEMLKAGIEWTRAHKWSCSGNAFWMFADAYTGYTRTILDYYNRRKPSFYAVRRAFAPVLPIAQDEETDVVVTVVNDLMQDVSGTLEVLLCRFDGGTETISRDQVTVPANSAHVCLRIQNDDLGSIEETVVWMRFAMKDGATIENRFFPIGLHTKLCRIPVAEVEIEPEERDGLVHAINIRSGRFVRNFRVVADEPLELSDNWIDLPPGGTCKLRLHRPVRLDRLEFGWDNRSFRLEDVLKSGTDRTRCVAGGSTSIPIALFNPDISSRTVRVAIRPPEGWRVAEPVEATLAPFEYAEIPLRLACPLESKAGARTSFDIHLRHADLSLTANVPLTVLPAIELTATAMQGVVIGRIANRSEAPLDHITLIEAWEEDTVRERRHGPFALCPGDWREWRMAPGPETRLSSYTVFAQTPVGDDFTAAWFRKPRPEDVASFRPEGAPLPPDSPPVLQCRPLGNGAIPRLRNAPCYKISGEEGIEGWSCTGADETELRLFLHYSKHSLILDAFVQDQPSPPEQHSVSFRPSMEIALTCDAELNYEACLGTHPGGSRYTLRRLKGRPVSNDERISEHFAAFHDDDVGLSHFRLIVNWARIATDFVPEPGARVRCAFVFNVGHERAIFAFGGIHGRKDPTRYGELELI